MNIQILKKSYEIVFLMLICITILLYFRSTNNSVEDKHVLSLQLSAFVTSIASLHYYYMMTSNNSPVSYRYFDWFFTTPILLIDLCILLDIYDTDLMYKIVGLNTIMLATGYLGEMKILSMFNSTILGFIPFIIMFYMIYSRMKERQKSNNKNSETTQQNMLYNIFVLLWTGYGINHLVPNINMKNITYNILDLITKGFFGLYVYNASWNIF